MEKADIFVTQRSSVVASEESKTSATDVEEQLQLADGDAVLRCFSPLLNSMKLFGLYFTQASRHVHHASCTSTPGTIKDSQALRRWSGGRVYATVILVVMWLNAVRMLSVFDKADRFGAVLLQKLGALSAGLFTAIQQTACFVACQTGNLDRVFSDARLPKSDIARYRRLAVVHAAVCWILLLTDASIFTYPLLMVDSTLNWWSMTPVGVYVFVSDQLLVVAKVTTSLLFIVAEFIWFFSHSLNYYTPRSYTAQKHRLRSCLFLLVYAVHDVHTACRPT